MIFDILTSGFPWSISYTLGTDGINVQLTNFLLTVCELWLSVSTCLWCSGANDWVLPIQEAGNQDSMESKGRKTNKQTKGEKLWRNQRISTHEINFLARVTRCENNTKGKFQNVLRKVLFLKDQTNLSMLIRVYTEKNNSTKTLQKHFPFP